MNEHMLQTVSAWASILGLIISITSMLVTLNVKKKVNIILKTKEDESYFKKKAPIILENLNMVIMLAEKSDETVFSDMQYSFVNAAILLIEKSLEIFFRYDNKIVRAFKVFYWKIKLKKGEKVFESRTENFKLVIKFLNQLNCIIEKELGRNG